MDRKQTAIKIEGVGKLYRLGLVSTKTLSHDLNRWFHRIRGKEDPYLKIGETNERENKGSSEYVWALKDVSFDIDQGDTVGIIGRNGAGKSTLLKILSRVTQPSAGSIKVKGRIASLLEVGTGFHPELTGRENIYLNGAILGMRRHEITRKLDQITDFSGVERYLDTPVKRYSSGMYVRLAFAVAAHLDSEILVVDEVLAVGDAEFQKKCLGRMSKVSKGEGRTVLFVSHNLSAVESLCNKGVVLSRGSLIAQGSAQDMVKKYLEIGSDQIRSYQALDIESALGNEFIKIVSARVLESSTMSDKTLLDVSSEILIELEIINKTNSPVISVGFDLKTLKGDILFGTGGKFDCGFNTSKTLSCKIPGHLLNTEIYQVSAYFHTEAMAKLYSKDELLSFEVKDTKREAGYLGKINGLIRVSLPWEVR
ncbi:MAG: polysaccharide ABC transporter ATP-binding protein [Flavobacteriales bacterium]